MVRKIGEVEALFDQLELQVSIFKNSSCLSCMPDCGDCCKKEDIEATVLEFLPAAYDLYLKGDYNTILDQIESKNDNYCIFYNPFTENGLCSEYKNRGLICRLFGFSSRIDKKGNYSLVSCRKLKDKMYQAESLKDAPELASWYMKLYGIDPYLSIKYLPVNIAIKKAIESVLFYFQFKKKPA